MGGAALAAADGDSGLVAAVAAGMAEWRDEVSADFDRGLDAVLSRARPACRCSRGGLLQRRSVMGRRCRQMMQPAGQAARHAPGGSMESTTPAFPVSRGCLVCLPCAQCRRQPQLRDGVEGGQSPGLQAARLGPLIQPFFGPASESRMISSGPNSRDTGSAVPKHMFDSSRQAFSPMSPTTMRIVVRRGDSHAAMSVSS